MRPGLPAIRAVREAVRLLQQAGLAVTVARSGDADDWLIHAETPRKPRHKEGDPIPDSEGGVKWW